MRRHFLNLSMFKDCVDCETVIDIPKRVEWLLNTKVLPEPLKEFLREYVLMGKDKKDCEGGYYRFNKLVSIIRYYERCRGLNLLFIGDWVSHYNSVFCEVQVEDGYPLISSLIDANRMSDKLGNILIRSGYKSLADIRGRSFEDLIELRGISKILVDELMVIAYDYGIRIYLRFNKEKDNL